MKIVNPATNESIEEVAEDTAASIQVKFEAARKAQADWASTPLSERCACISKFATAVTQQRERLALILTREMGKPITQSQNELKSLIARIEFFLASVAAASEAEMVQSRSVAGTEERISHEPLGVVACISAWNYPWFVGSNVFVPALLTGNAVLYKPSEYATLTGLAITELLHASGVPTAVFQAVVGAGAVAECLLDQALDGVFFTGSYATGRKIASKLGPRMLRLQLELGGKDPTYVCEDADVQAAAASLADGAMYNAGQSCCSVERIYVHERVADAFEAALVEQVKAFVIGAPEAADTYIGPLARRAQLEVLLAQVEEARSLGAQIACGGSKIDGVAPYFQPTVVLGAAQQMRVMREESFGPIVGVCRVKSDAEAVAYMNDTEYGLTAGVYSKDEARATRIMGQLKAGSVYFNCCDRVSPRLPWSGVGNSGIGTTLSVYGIRSFQRLKAWHLRA